MFHKCPQCGCFCEQQEWGEPFVYGGYDWICRNYKCESFGQKVEMFMTISGC